MLCGFCLRSESYKVSSTTRFQGCQVLSLFMGDWAQKTVTTISLLRLMTSWDAEWCSGLPPVGSPEQLHQWGGLHFQRLTQPLTNLVIAYRSIYFFCNIDPITAKGKVCGDRAEFGELKTRGLKL